MIELTVKNKVSFPELKLQDDLVHIATKIVMPFLKRQIVVGQDLQEKTYPPLAQSTLKIKAEKRQPPYPLQAEGKLREGFIFRKLGKSSVMITINSLRKEIGNILQNKGVKTKSGKRYFNFFGLNSRMEDEAMIYMRTRIKEEINKR